jgi:hypothetical protein
MVTVTEDPEMPKKSGKVNHTTKCIEGETNIIVRFEYSKTRNGASQRLQLKKTRTLEQLLLNPSARLHSETISYKK